MLWFAEQGYAVFGIELSEIACEDYFRLQDIAPQVTSNDRFTIYQHENTELWAGDFFTLTAAQLSEVVAVYDRAALIALPEDMRKCYASHMAAILPTAAETLLLTMKYDQQKMKGPPFSVSHEEVRALYSDSFDVIRIAESSGPDIVGNLKERGLDTLEETVFRLTATG